MAADLEFRVDAEMAGIRKALADLRSEFGALGKIKVPQGAFDGVEKGAASAGRATDRLREGFAKLGQAGRDNLEKLRVGQQLTDGLTRAGRAADELKRKLADVNKPPPGGGSGGNPLAPIEGSANGAILAVKGLVAAFATIQTVRVVADLADQSANLSGRLRLVTSSQEEFNAAYAGLFRIAQSTRQPLEATVGLYTKLAQNLTDTPQALLRLTETIGKAVALSGSSAQASEAAIVQLGQGLASGTLRGEELNSVLEQTPALADAIAKGLGITRGELRKYAEQGKITAEAIKTALGNQAGAIDAAFAKLPTTISQSVTTLKNAALQYVGVFDEANGLSSGFAVTIKALADNLGTLVSAFGAVVAVPFAVAIGRASVALVGLVTAARASAVALGGATVAARGFAVATAFMGGPVGIILSLLGLSAAAYLAYKTNAEVANRSAATSTERSTDQIITAIRKQIDEIKERNRILAQGAEVSAPTSQPRADLTTAEKSYREALAKLGTGQNEAQNIAFAEIARTRGEAYGRIAAEVNKLNDAETVSLRLAQRQKQVDYLKEYANNAEKLAAELKKAKDELGPLFTPDIEARIRDKFKPKGGGAGDENKAARDKAAAALESVKVEADLAVDQTTRALKVIDGLYSDNLISIRDYYAAKTTLEQSSIDIQIKGLETEKALAKEAADRIKIDGDIAKLRLDRADAANVNARAEIEANKKIADSLADISSKMLALNGDEVGARRAELERQYADLIASLEAASDTAGVSLVRRLINTEVARAQFDALKAEFDRVQQDLQNRQQQIADQRNAGGLTPDVASQQTSDARRVAEAELQRINTQLQELAKNINDPAIRRGADESAEALRRMAIDGATGLDGAVIDLRANLSNLREGFAKTAVSSGVDGLTNMFAGLADGSKSLGQGLKDFARSFASSMAQVAARALATIAVLSLLEAIFPGSGKLIAASGSASAAVNHAGGMAGTGPRRMVNPLVFAGAPRYHSGGMVGLKPDERPAILQTGERVLNRQQTADYNGGGSGSGAGTRVINVIDPNLVQDYMTSSGGERTILNVIERNAGAIRQKLG